MKRFVAVMAAGLLASCAGAPPAERATAAEPAPVCVVSLDGEDPGCPETPVARPNDDDDEPCVERVADDAFMHGPGARLYAFCTPAQSARKAAKAGRKDKEWPGVPR